MEAKLDQLCLVAILQEPQTWAGDMTGTDQEIQYPLMLTWSGLQIGLKPHGPEEEAAGNGSQAGQRHFAQPPWPCLTATSVQALTQTPGTVMLAMGADRTCWDSRWGLGSMAPKKKQLVTAAKAGQAHACSASG